MKCGSCKEEILSGNTMEGVTYCNSCFQKADVCEFCSKRVIYGQHVISKLACDACFPKINIARNDPRIKHIRSITLSELKAESVNDEPYLLFELKQGASAQEINLAYEKLKEIYNPAYFSDNAALQNKVKYKRDTLIESYESLKISTQRRMGATSEQNPSSTLELQQNPISTTSQTKSNNIEESEEQSASNTAYLIYQSAPSSSTGSFWACKPMRYIYALIACFVVLILSAAIKGLLGLGAVGGGAIPAMIISIAIFGTWYVITKKDNIWIAYFASVLVIGAIGTIIVGNLSQTNTGATALTVERNLPTPLQANLKPLIGNVDPVPIAKDSDERHLLQIRTKHPDAQILSPEVEKWISTLPPKEKAKYKKVMDKGTAQEIIELFDIYKSSEFYHLAQILAKHPDAQDIVPEVEKWISTFPESTKARYTYILDKGTAQEIIELFDIYKHSRM